MSGQAPTGALPELAEVDAPPDIAAIYRDIRRLSAVPMVALIWRHLATRPDVLQRAWGVLGPLFETGAVQTAAWTRPSVAKDVTITGFDARSLRAAGVDTAGMSEVVRVLDAYNRANPVNFVAVRTLLHAAGAAHGVYDDQRTVWAAGPAVENVAAEPGTGWRPPPPIGPLVAMAPLSAMPPASRRLVDELSSDPRVDRATVVPSLYRHLVAWPALLPLVHAVLAPLFRSGEIASRVAVERIAMDRSAARLAETASARIALEPDVVRVLDDFTALVIPEMVVVGTLLRQAIGTQVA